MTDKTPKEIAQHSLQKAGSLLDEFKKFAFKGNVIDLAIGVIIGAAFGKIVDSLVKNIIMPLVSLVVPAEHSYTAWEIVIGDKKIPFGLFLGDVVNFLIVAFAVYIFIVKFLALLMRNKEAAPPPPTKTEELLTEIRDLLKKDQGETPPTPSPQPIA
jgi:large conductance mechanosensitive channel